MGYTRCSQYIPYIRSELCSHILGEDNVHLILKYASIDGEDSDMDSLAGSDIVDPDVLRDMLTRMDDDGEDSRAAARYFYIIQYIIKSVSDIIAGLQML